MNLALEQMIGQQVRTWEVLDPQTLEVMRQVPREIFVAEAWRSLAYADSALPLAHGKHMLPPMVVGRILQALAPQAGARVLEIGTGSGYLTACLCAFDASVRSLELYDDLALAARGHLHAAGCGGFEVLQADGTKLDEPPSYDAIVLTASLPIWDTRYERALKLGGRLFAVTGIGPAMEARLIERRGNGEFQRTTLFETSLEAMEHSPRPEPFQF
jgi:protein-L-isoaspartate(D-aspartate) O-methyltransferase